MDKESSSVNRRSFLRTTAAVTAGFAGLGVLPQIAMARETPDEGINIIGPKSGYSPQIGTLVSMLDWMRMVVLRSVQKMTTEQLDFFARFKIEYYWCHASAPGSHGTLLPDPHI